MRNLSDQSYCTYILPTLFFPSQKDLNPLLSEGFIHVTAVKLATIELYVTPMLPLYYGLCGTGPSGLCEVTAHTTCSDRVSPWLLGSISGHAWRGRCIDLVLQMPSDTHKHNAQTHTHTLNVLLHSEGVYWHAHIHNLYNLHLQRPEPFHRFLCNFGFNDTLLYMVH